VRPRLTEVGSVFWCRRWAAAAPGSGLQLIQTSSPPLMQRMPRTIVMKTENGVERAVVFGIAMNRISAVLLDIWKDGPTQANSSRAGRDRVSLPVDRVTAAAAVHACLIWKANIKTLRSILAMVRSLWLQ
jgi:hypothetical protein